MIGQNNLVPMVTDNSGGGERAYDIYSLLLKERIVFLGGEIDDGLANLAVAELLYLNSVNSETPISLYINSNGGGVYAGLAIYDTMRSIRAPVSTVAVGFTGSMATFLLSAGTHGRRRALPHATIHMHPTAGGSRGYTEDVRIATREQERLQTQVFHLMGKHSGHTWQEIEEFFLRDRFLNAEQARDYGVIDEVIGDVDDIVMLQDTTTHVSLVEADSQSTQKHGRNVYSWTGVEKKR